MSAKNEIKFLFPGHILSSFLIPLRRLPDAENRRWFFPVASSSFQSNLCLVVRRFNERSTLMRPIWRAPFPPEGLRRPDRSICSLPRNPRIFSPPALLLLLVSSPPGTSAIFLSSLEGVIFSLFLLFMQILYRGIYVQCHLYSLIW